jgi:hypothetical protein
MTGYFIAGATSTGAPLTINVNSLGAKNVYLNGSPTTATYTVLSGLIYPFYYDGTEIQLTGASPVPAFSSGIVNTSNTCLACGANATYLITGSYVPPLSAGFSHIYINIQTADGTGFYSWAVVNPAGSVICSTTATHLAATGWVTATEALCSQGTVQWTGGNLYLIGTGNATTAQISTGYGSVPMPFANTGSVGSTSSGQVSSTTVTMPAAGATYAASSGFILE